MFPSTFRQIEVFIAVVEAGSFAAAADRLSIATSSVSTHIRSLERHIGCDLFLRRRGGVSNLTEPGRRLYERALAVLEQVEQLNRELSRNRPQGARRRVTIAIQRLMANRYLAGPVADFTGRHPEAEIVVETGYYEDVIEHLANGTADLGYIMYFGSFADMPSIIIDHEPVGIFCGPGHPLAGRTAIRPSELATHGFLATRQDRRFGQMINSVLFSIGVTNYTLVSQIQDGAMMGELVSRGVGIMCGLTRALEPQIAEGRLIPLDVDCPPLQVDVHQVFTPQRKPQQLAVEFADHMRAIRR
ncbi:MAG TPA: LysR family transcriptional regulator [Azospirillum sp.]|nr:LysR family transcriptional regulator [Azospirillum sp.]